MVCIESFSPLFGTFLNASPGFCTFHLARNRQILRWNPPDAPIPDTLGHFYSLQLVRCKSCRVIVISVDGPLEKFEIIQPSTLVGITISTEQST